MVDGSCHGVRRTKEGSGQAQNGVEMLMHMAWVTHHHCSPALEQSVMGGAVINIRKHKKIPSSLRANKTTRPDCAWSPRPVYRVYG